MQLLLLINTLTILISSVLNQDLDFLIPTFEIDLPTQKTTTRIYLDFLIFTMTDTEMDEIFEFFKTITRIIKTEPGEPSLSLLNVLNDLTTLKRSIRHLNTITKDLLNSKETQPSSSPCSYSRHILSKNHFNDLLESFLLIKNKFAPDFVLSTEEKNDPSNENFRKVAESLLSIKGIVHEFSSYFDTQYSLLNDLENLKMPNLIPHNLNLDKCVRTSGKETFYLQKIKFYNKGVYATIKLVQSHDFQTFYSITPVPLAGIVLDLENLFTPVNENSTYYHQVCTDMHETKTCMLKTFQTPCLDAIKERQIQTILQACPIKTSQTSNPFLTFYGVFIPPETEISLLDTSTQSVQQNFSAPSNPYNLPYILRSEFTIEVIHNDITYLFGPTGTFTEIIDSYLTLNDLTLIRYFIEPYLNPTYQIYFSLATGLSITVSLVLILTVKLVKPKNAKPNKKQYSASLHKTRTPTFIKINK